MNALRAKRHFLALWFPVVAQWPPCAPLLALSGQTTPDPAGGPHERNGTAQRRHRHGADRGEGSLYRAQQKSFARFVEATAVMPGGNTRTVLHYSPFPHRHRARRGLPPVGPGRRRIRRLPGRIHRRHLRPLASGDPRRGGSRAGRRHQFRRHQPDRGEVRPRRVRPVRAGACALHQLRHRGEPAGDFGRPHLHQAPQGDGVQRRLPRRGVRLRRRRLADQRAVRVRAGAVQRHRRARVR